MHGEYKYIVHGKYMSLMRTAVSTPDMSADTTPTKRLSCLLGESDLRWSWPSHPHTALQVHAHVHVMCSGQFVRTVLCRGESWALLLLLLLLPASNWHTWRAALCRRRSAGGAHKAARTGRRSAGGALRAAASRRWWRLYEAVAPRQVEAGHARLRVEGAQRGARGEALGHVCEAVDLATHLGVRGSGSWVGVRVWWGWGARGLGWGGAEWS